MEPLALKDKDVFPSTEVLQKALGTSYTAFETLEKGLAAIDITPEWNYYRDGACWLCKMPYKKKNLGWISVFDNYFYVTCYFTEKHLDAIAQLNISDSTRAAFLQAKPAGKLIPMTITINSSELPEDVTQMLVFKKGLK